MECKIADFGISDNLSYESLKHNELYSPLIPPDCKHKIQSFSKKGDVYVNLKTNKKQNIYIKLN